PNAASEHLYDTWRTLLPTLVVSYLQYSAWTIGKPLRAFSKIITLCNQSVCERKSMKLLCLLFDRTCV
ncbi:hypothetical protein PAXINDRAFT_33689, partial [Paxillus involutus ATCC 200175]